MALLKRASEVLLLSVGVHCADAGQIWSYLYEPEMCYILDGFLAFFGLVMTGLFIKEKYFEKPKVAPEDSVYSDLKGQDTTGYAPLVRKGDPEAGKKQRAADETYTALKPREGEYRELPMKKERRRKTEQVYQGLSLGTKDAAYDSLQMKPLPSPR